MSKKIFIFVSSCLPLLFLACEQEALPDLREPVQEESSQEEGLYPMSIESLRQQDYPGGDFVLEQALSDGNGFERSIVSYQSEGLTIYGLLMTPLMEEPDGGFPAVVFVHGYIPPDVYETVQSYPTYPNYLAGNGFVVFKPDLRGHGNSEGEPVSAHYSEKYVIDTLNAISYLAQYERVNPDRIGYWGHSNGGEIGLRVVLASDQIQAASFWAGVVGPYETLFETLVDEISFLQKDNPLTQLHGFPSEGGGFWDAVEPYNYLEEIQIPIEVQHGTADESVPVQLSLELVEALEEAGVQVDYHEYPGDDHDIGANASRAWQRSVEFFQEYL